MAGNVVKVGPPCGSVVATGAATASVAALGIPILVYAASVATGAAAATLILADGGGTTKWALGAPIGGGSAISFARPLRTDGLRIITVGANCTATVQYEQTST